ncbi:transposase [Streptomyces sp. NPDC050704]|uniref:transposase n=1 Tax=Streptomyces sp. NPDC050704 TaxID=3157219 RepID=UPI0034244336
MSFQQWSVLEPLLPKGAKAGRPPVWPRRRLINGIRFRVRTVFRGGTCPSSTGHGAWPTTCSADVSRTAPGTGSSPAFSHWPTRRVRAYGT